MCMRFSTASQTARRTREDTACCLPQARTPVAFSVQEIPTTPLETAPRWFQQRRTFLQSTTISWTGISLCMFRSQPMQKRQIPSSSFVASAKRCGPARIPTGMYAVFVKVGNESDLLGHESVYLFDRGLRRPVRTRRRTAQADIEPERSALYVGAHARGGPGKTRRRRERGSQAAIRSCNRYRGDCDPIQ